MLPSKAEICEVIDRTVDMLVKMSERLIELEKRVKELENVSKTG